MSLAHSGHQSAPILRQPVPSCGAKGQSKRHHEGFVCPQPLVPLWFGKPDPALLSTPSLGLKLAHKFFGCLAPALPTDNSNQMFPAVGPIPPPLSTGYASPCPRGREVGLSPISLLPTLQGPSWVVGGGRWA